MAAGFGGGQSRYGHWLAAQGISSVLDMEESRWSMWKTSRGEGISQLIRRMCRENPLWGAPKIHGELLKLGINISESTVFAKLENVSGEPSERYGFCGLVHGSDDPVSNSVHLPRSGPRRRRIVHFAVTQHPTAEWTAQQLREAFPWDTAVRFLLRDRDRIFGQEFVEQAQAMGIEEVFSTLRSPWQRASWND